MQFAEDFLHYIWKFRLFNQQNLFTLCGQQVEILQTGLHNTNAGPDFENSRVRLHDTIWAGNVEIHIRSSDWLRHNHQTDPAYNSVILHVVYECDTEIFSENGTSVPQICIRHRIAEKILENYERLMIGLDWIPCNSQIGKVDPFIIKSWLSRVLIERLGAKTKIFTDLLSENKGSWDDAFYVMLARNFGFKTNALPFELLARALPQQILAKHKGNPLQIEALVFGQAGFLERKFADPYPSQLKKEYRFLKAKYKFRPVDHFTWKYLRLRPGNFPGVRLAQFAALINKSNHLFSIIRSINDVREISLLFEDLPINNYWNSHFRFDTESAACSKQMGTQSINNVLINTVSVSLAAYGGELGQEEYIERAVKLLETIPAESNKVIDRYVQMGVKPKNADDTQALLHLKQCYCDLKKCLHCGIGVNILKQ